ncbi:7457_t:CDS:2, partial [Funneliformis geosporum]
MTEETLVHIRKYNTKELFNFLQRKGLQLNDTHFRILLEEEIDGSAFLLLNEKRLNDCGFKVGSVAKLADLILKLNGEERASLPQDELPTAGVVVEPLHKSISTERISDKLTPLLENQQTPHVKSQTIAQSLHPDLKLKGSSIEKVEYPNDINENNTHLPETASGLLRYYELWNCHYTKWPSLNEYSEHLSNVKKDRVHHSFKKEIEVLRKLFVEDHPAQLRLTQLEGQLKALRLLASGLCAWAGSSRQCACERNVFSWDESRAHLTKMCQTSRIIKKATRKQIANATKLLTKEATIKKELEIVEDSVIVNGYRRINKHYNDFHEASTQLIKRKLTTDNPNSDGNEDGLKKAR